MRKSLASLLSQGFRNIEFTKRFKIDFYTGPPLWSFMQKVTALLASS